MSELPFVDEHAVEIDATPEATWRAIVSVTRGAFGGRANEAFARALGCEPTTVSGPAGEPGSTVVGFRIERAEAPRELDLAGRHRFSEYRLAFLVDPLAGGRSRARARTHARFPGAAGRLYRAAVIGTGAHVVLTRRLLAAIARRAEAAAGL